MINANRDIIIVTAHQKYASQAAEFQSFDFLLKPVGEKHMARLMERLYSKYSWDGTENFSGTSKI